MLKNLMFFLSFLLVFQACSNETDTTPTTQTPPKDILSKPHVVLPLLDGGEIIVIQNDETWDFDGFEGRLKLLFFFDITCEPCRAMLPHLVDIQSHYANHLEIFGILTQPEPSLDTLNMFLESYNINFKVAHFSEAFNEIFYNSSDVPYTLLYDLNGRLIADYNGVLPQEMLEFDIRKTLEQNGEDGEESEEGDAK